MGVEYWGFRCDGSEELESPLPAKTRKMKFDAVSNIVMHACPCNGASVECGGKCVPRQSMECGGKGAARHAALAKPGESLGSHEAQFVSRVVMFLTWWLGDGLDLGLGRSEWRDAATAVWRCASHRTPCMGASMECGGKGRSPPRRFG